MPQSDDLNFSSAGFLLVTGGYDHTLKLWDVGTSDCLRSFDHPDSVSCFNINYEFDILSM